MSSPHLFTLLSAPLGGGFLPLESQITENNSRPWASNEYPSLVLWTLGKSHIFQSVIRQGPYTHLPPAAPGGHRTEGVRWAAVGGSWAHSLALALALSHRHSQPFAATRRCKPACGCLCFSVSAREKRKLGFSDEIYPLFSNWKPIKKIRAPLKLA